LRISGLHDSIDGADEPFPSRSLLREHLPSGGRDAVVAATALAGFLDPAPGDPASLLEAIEQRIQRRDAEAGYSDATRKRTAPSERSSITWLIS
jgi:hypothetical protein